MKEEMKPLYEARKNLTDKIAELNWGYNFRLSKLQELNNQIESIDKIILAMLESEARIAGTGEKGN